MPHKIKSIEWKFNEGYDYDFDGEHFTLEQANEGLHIVANDMVGEDGNVQQGYDKVGFIAHFHDDDTTYEGRFDVHALGDKQETDSGLLCFRDHMVGFLLFTFGDSKPNHMEQEKYFTYIKDTYKYTTDEIQEWKDLLGMGDSRAEVYKLRLYKLHGNAEEIDAAIKSYMSQYHWTEYEAAAMMVRKAEKAQMNKEKGYVIMKGFGFNVSQDFDRAAEDIPIEIEETRGGTVIGYIKPDPNSNLGFRKYGAGPKGIRVHTNRNCIGERNND